MRGRYFIIQLAAKDRVFFGLSDVALGLVNASDDRRYFQRLVVSYLYGRRLSVAVTIGGREG
jgi:hypothetical protein